MGTISFLSCTVTGERVKDADLSAEDVGCKEDPMILVHTDWQQNPLVL